MENVTQAVQDELVKSLDYKLGSSNVNYIQSRRDIQYFPSSLSTFTPTTSRVARIPLTSGMDFIDPESIKIAFRVRNNDATLDLSPGTQEPSCFIKRVQLFANGQRCDDISEYGRSCFLYSLLKPAEWYKNKGITGFWELAGLTPAPVPAQSFKDVLMAPTLIGMFQAGKFLPPQLNLVLELEFAEPADALRPGGGSTDYSIENVRVLASQVTLDSALYESYQKILLSGRSLVFAYPTMHTQVSSIPAGSTSHNVTVARAFTKLLGAFVSFRDVDDNLGECSNFEHPGDGSQFSANALESQMQLGSLQYPRYPMASDAEHFHFLEILAGTYDSSIKNMRIADNLWNNTQFIAAFPVERVPKHPLSGISTTLTGRILDDGVTEPPVIELQGISAGQLATVLTAYTPLETSTQHTADIGTNAAAIAALQGQVAALPAAPDLAPYALASDLAAAEGLIAANASGLTAVNTSLTLGLAAKASQSALDALQVEVDGKSTPASVDLKLSNHPTTAAMNSSIASANNATLASVATTYALKSVVDQLALDVAARQTAGDVAQAIATALLPLVSTSDLTAAVALRTTPADVSQLIATALLPFRPTSRGGRRAGPQGRPPGRARHGDPGPPKRRALRHGRRPQHAAAHPAIRHRRHFGGDLHARWGHELGQRPRLAGERDLGPAGRDQYRAQHPRHGPPEHCPGQ